MLNAVLTVMAHEPNLAQGPRPGDIHRRSDPRPRCPGGPGRFVLWGNYTQREKQTAHRLGRAPFLTTDTFHLRCISQQMDLRRPTVFGDPTRHPSSWASGRSTGTAGPLISFETDTRLDQAASSRRDAASSLGIPPHDLGYRPWHEERPAVAGMDITAAGRGFDPRRRPWRLQVDGVMESGRSGGRRNNGRRQTIRSRRRCGRCRPARRAPWTGQYRGTIRAAYSPARDVASQDSIQIAALAGRRFVWSGSRAVQADRGQHPAQASNHCPGLGDGSSRLRQPSQESE